MLVAERIVALLAALDVPVVVIGAVALAAHGYIRFTEDIDLRPGSLLRITPIPQLVALKLYAGGWSSKADIIELLRRNPETDLEMLRETCGKYRLNGLEELLEELGQH